MSLPKLLASKTKEELAAHMQMMRDKSLAKKQERREVRIEQLAQFVAMNPLATAKEAMEVAAIKDKSAYYNLLRQPAFKEKIESYKQEFVNPIVGQEIADHYKTLALMAVERAQQKLEKRDCKDSTIVEILRVCGQYLSPKGNVNINAGRGSLVQVLSDMQSSAQESLEIGNVIDVPKLEP